MALLGLTCAAFIGAASPMKGFASLLIGLFVATIGLNNPAGVPRFTFGSTQMLAGIDFIPAMIGLFAVSEVFRTIAAGAPPWDAVQRKVGNIFRSWGNLIRTYWRQQIRGNITGTARVEAGPAGLHLTALLPEDVDDQAVSATAGEKGVEAPALSRYYLDGEARNGLVLGFAPVAPDEMSPAVRILERAIAEASARESRRAG
jgi:TctA family transporter